MSQSRSADTEFMLDGVSGGSDKVQLEAIIVESSDPNVMWHTIELGPTSITVGRDESAGLTVSDTRMSREHGRFEWDTENNAPAVRDLTSSNGTFVDGKRRQSVVLEVGAVIRMGSTCMVVRQRPSADLSTGDTQSALKGRSAGIANVRKQLKKVAHRDSIVLITGDTGTGKEVVANELHRLSERQGRFIAVNCAAISEALVESTLFGHRKGAFSGAHENRDGVFVQANRGTLFLDEIGELPAAMQPKLLRVLQDFRVTPVGGNQSHQVDTRVIAATNVLIKRAVQENQFRADLLARLKEWPVELPPLRERKEDICYLFTLFLTQELQKDERPMSAKLDALAAEALLLYDWPLNVREVQKLAGRIATQLESDGPILLEMLPTEIQEEFTQQRTERVDEADGGDVGLEAVERAMKKAHGKVARAARILNVSRKTMYSYFKKYQINVDQYR